VGGSAALWLLGRETKNITKGAIETEHGIFVPLYEEHYGGINEKRIPQDTNIFFMEGGGFLNEGPEVLTTDVMQRKRLIPNEILIKLANQGSEVMLGDVLRPKAMTDYTIFGAESFVGVVLFRIAIGEKLDSRYPKLSRKQFLAALAGAVWLASPFATLEIAFFTSVLTENTTIRRIAARIGGLVSNLHPENTTRFFRDLIMAEKMLEAAREYKERTGTKPKIAYDVGIGHGGVEDFLQAGQNITRALILAYPTPILKDAVKNNGGIEEFCTINLYKLPPNLTPDDLEKRVAHETTMRNIGDVKLAESLKDRLKI